MTPRERATQKQREVREKRRAAGLCNSCSAPAERGRAQCFKHLEANRLAASRHYYKRQKERHANADL